MPETLHRRLLQQATLAELGLRALDRQTPEALADYAVAAVSEALGVDAVAVFEHQGDAFIATAHTGWPAPPRVAPQSPYIKTVLAASEPVPLEASPPSAFAEAGVSGGITLRLGGEGDWEGLLGAYSTEPRSFSPEEHAFLVAVGVVLAGAQEQARTTQALHESEARARAVVETTVDGVITIDERAIIESFNPAAERIFGYTASEVRGKNIAVLMPEPYRTEHDGYVNAYLTTGHRRIIGIGREVRGRRKDGSTFPMDLAVSESIMPDGRRVFTGLIRDISERRELEQEVLRIAEAERRRIGQDLHDGLGQMLTGTALIARGVARQLAAHDSPFVEDAEEVVQHIKEADAFARSLARGLVPVELEANGLSAALNRLAHNAERLFGIECSFTSSGNVEAAALSDPIPTHLFRIAQEALSNAVRHGRARHVSITLAYGIGQLRLRVEDDGAGVPMTLRTGGLERPADSPPMHQDENRGMGIRIMHYRARVMGGALEIRPGTAGGTVVTCTLPLRSNAI